MEGAAYNMAEDEALFTAAFTVASVLPSSRTTPTFSLNTSLSFSPLSRYCRIEKDKKLRRITRLESFKHNFSDGMYQFQMTAQQKVDEVKAVLETVLQEFLAKGEKISSFVEENVQIPHMRGLLPAPPIRPSHPLRSLHLAAILPSDSVAAVVATTSIFNFLNIYNTLLIGRLVLTWFPNPPEIIASPLSTICDPYLNLFRGIIPPIGGSLDFSPILAFLVLNVFTNAASALPAEMPSPFPKPEPSLSIALSSPTEDLTTQEREKLSQIMDQSIKAPKLAGPSNVGNM